MDIKIDLNYLDNQKLFDNGVTYGLYSVMIDGCHRGNIWLTDDEIERLREDYDIGLMFCDR